MKQRYQKTFKASKLVNAYQTYHRALDGGLTASNRRALAQRGVKPPSQRQYKLKLLLTTAIEYAKNELDDCLKMMEVQEERDKKTAKLKTHYKDDPALALEEPHLLLAKRERNLYTKRHAAIVELYDALKAIETIFYPQV